MQQVKSLWQTLSVVVMVLGGLMIAGGMFIGNELLRAGGFCMLGGGLGLQGLYALVYAEASVRMGRYHTKTRYGWGARLYGLQEGFWGTVLVAGGLWWALAPGQMLIVATLPLGWSLIAILVALFILLGSLVSLSGVSDRSESAWHTVPNRIGGVIGLIIAAGVGLFGVVTFVMPSVWTMLLGLVGVER